MTPGIITVFQHQGSRRRAGKIFSAPNFVIEGLDESRRWIKSDGQDVVLQNAVGVGDARRRRCGSAVEIHGITGVAHGGQRGAKEQTDSIRNMHRCRGDHLIGDLGAGGVEQSGPLCAQRPLHLYFHPFMNGAGVGIEQHKGRSLRWKGVGRDVLYHPAAAERQALCRFVLSRSQLCAAVVIGGFNAGTAEDIVKLIEQHLFPGRSQQSDRGARQRLHTNPLHFFRGQQSAFSMVDLQLDAAVRRIAAAAVIMQLIDDQRPGAAQAFDLSGVGVQRSETDFSMALHQLLNLFDRCPGRAAAVIADAIKHRIGQLIITGKGGQAGLQLALIRIVRLQNAKGEDLCAVGALPAKDQARQAGLFHGVRSHEKIDRQILAGQDLRQRVRMAKGVGRKTASGLAAEMALKKPLAVQPLADQGFAVWNVDVRLHPPTADQIPPARLNHALNIRKESGICLPHPFIELGGAGDERRFRKFAQTIDGGLKGGQHFGDTLSLVPAPYRVDMRVSDHAKGSR
ncbi:MAG: hypothetical protein BWY83_02638 [bacterium ADurb.Bin478]|nr:MAG: hypothetical protein BWY83_02638 [bacterium ADurb.Bin478]